MVRAGYRDAQGWCNCCAHVWTCFGEFPGLVIDAVLRYHSGMDRNSIENLARKLAEAVPEGLRSARHELEENFQSVLKQGLNRLDLVTREEFEVQEAVLARTREKLEALEARLKELEKD